MLCSSKKKPMGKINKRYFSYMIRQQILPLFCFSNSLFEENLNILMQRRHKQYKENICCILHIKQGLK